MEIVHHEARIEAAIEKVRQVLEAAENSNQHGENCIVHMADSLKSAGDAPTQLSPEDDIANQIDRLKSSLAENAERECVAVRLFFNHEGHTLEFDYRDPNMLRSQSQSMRNLRGEFI